MLDLAARGWECILLGALGSIFILQTSFGYCIKTVCEIFSAVRIPKAVVLRRLLCSLPGLLRLSPFCARRFGSNWSRSRKFTEKEVAFSQQKLKSEKAVLFWSTILCYLSYWSCSIHFCCLFVVGKEFAFRPGIAFSFLPLRYRRCFRLWKSLHVYS